MPRRVETPQDADSIKRIAERLDACSARLRAVAEMMVVKEIATLKATHYWSVSTGIRGVEDYARAAEMAIYDAMEERGDFRATRPKKKP